MSKETHQYGAAIASAIIGAIVGAVATGVVSVVINTNQKTISYASINSQLQNDFVATSLMDESILDADTPTQQLSMISEEMSRLANDNQSLQDSLLNVNTIIKNDFVSTSLIDENSLDGASTEDQLGIISDKMLEMKTINDEKQETINEDAAAIAEKDAQIAQLSASPLPEPHYYPSTGQYLLNVSEEQSKMYCSFDEETTVNGKLAANGFRFGDDGSVTFYLNGNYSLLQFNIGSIDDRVSSKPIHTQFYVELDDNVWDGPEGTPLQYDYGDAPLTDISVDVNGVTKLVFKWTGGNASGYAFATSEIKVFE